MKKIIVFGALLALLASCSSNDFDIDSSSNNELVVKAGIQGMADSKSVKAGTVFDDQDSIAVFISLLRDDDPVYRQWPTYYKFDKSKNYWNYTSGGAKSSTKIYLLAEAHKLCAFYPAPRLDTQTGKYNSEFVNATQGELSNFSDGLSSIEANINYVHIHHSAISNKFDGSDQNDYMMGAPKKVSGADVLISASDNANVANVEFTHLLTKVSFIINKAQDYVKPGLVTKVTLSDSKSPFYSLGDDISSPTAIGKSVVRLESETYLLNSSEILNKHPESVVGFIYTTGTNANMYSSPSSKTPIVTGLIVPREAVINEDGSVTVTLVVDGRTYVAEIPYNTNSATGFKGNFVPGKNYRFNLTLNPDALQFESITMTDWQDVVVSTPIDMN